MPLDSQQVIERTAQHIQQRSATDASGHDWWHTHRVRQTALLIGELEGADLYVVELAALLHDIADWKFHDGDESKGPQVARSWLESLGVAGQTTEHVCNI